MAKPGLSKRPAASGRSAGFVYKRRDPSALKDRAEQTGGRFDSPFKQGFDTFRPKVGDNLIRILPPTWDDFEHYAYDLYMHRYIGQDSSSYLCLNKMLGKQCPICDAAKASKDAGEVDEAKQLAYAKLACAWIIDRDDEQKEHPILYPMGWTMDRDIAALCWNKRTGKALAIDHPSEGFDITIKRTGQGLMTRYFGIAVDRDPSYIDEDEAAQERILEYIMANPVPDTLNYYDADYLTKVLSGATSEKDKELDEEEEVEETPPPRRGARAAASAEEEEEEAPPPRRGTRAAVEDGDEEEVEDAAPPPRRARAAAPPAEEEEEEAPPPRRSGPPRPRAQSQDEEEEAPPPPRRSARTATPTEEEEEEAPPPPRRPARR